MKKYYIITIGCQMNKSDSERLASVLEKQGYKKSDNKYQADLVVINTCGVRQSAEDKVYGLIPIIKKQNKKAKIMVTGCLVYREDVKRRLKEYVDLWLSITKISNFQLRTLGTISKIPPTIPREYSGHAFTKGKKGNDYLGIQPKYQAKLSAFVPIGNGCDNFCSYCVVPYARGREVYRPVEDILNEVKNLVKRGYKEIVLIAQNVNSYKNPPTPLLKGGFRGLDFADLLKMVNNIKGDFRIRFATSHPKDMSDKLIKAVANCEKVIKEIHLPAQSGDNEILKKMKRKYSVEHYKKIIKKIRRLMPGVKISTDIIVGFPGETKRQFNNTIKLFKEIKFSKAYIARYSPRPGTAAFKLADNVLPAEKKRRWLKLNSMIAYGKK